MKLSKFESNTISFIKEKVEVRKIIDETGQCLHAKTLGFVHPTTNKYVEFSSELPECFNNILNMFKDS